MVTRKAIGFVGALLVIVSSLLLGAAALAQSDVSAVNGGLTEEVAADFVERFDAIFNEDLDIADVLFAEDFIARWPLAPQVDVATWKAYISSMFANLSPVVTQTTNKVLIDGDHLTVHVTYRGTHEGAFFSAMPNSVPWAIDAISIFRFEDGKAVESWAVMDLGTLLLEANVVDKSLYTSRR